MGLFDFLKPKNKAEDMSSQPGINRPECDITKTQIMVDLFQVAANERDDEWRNNFYAHVQTASFACGDPQVFNGPDGFPYFVLKTPEPGKPFESFCIHNMKDDFLLAKGLGVAINPGGHSADWVFTYGDIVNLHVNNEFYSEGDHIELQNEEIIKKEEEVLVAQPSESYLPKQARLVLSSFLQSIGIKKPKIMMICRTIEGSLAQELAFNIFPEDYSSVEQLNSMLKQISWFLPRHYIVLSLPKNSNLTGSFEEL